MSYIHFLSKIFYYDKIDLGLFYFHVRAVFFLTSNDLPPLIFWLSTLACTLKHLKSDLSNMIRAWKFSKNAMLHKFGSKKKLYTIWPAHLNLFPLKLQQVTRSMVELNTKGKQLLLIRFICDISKEAYFKNYSDDQWCEFAVTANFRRI